MQDHRLDRRDGASGDHDPDGVRITRHASGPAPMLLIGAALVVLGVAALWWWRARDAGPQATGAVEGVSARNADHAAVDIPAAAAKDAHAVSAAGAPQQRDPNDLASYIAPGQPEPGMGEVIARLREHGVRTGIAAFNPPGTSPVPVGIAVPGDFPLPEGYVRHHQVTDDGQPIEAILMFSPDHEFHDAQGNPIPVPPDRVVPPRYAPPGLPIRMIVPPAPRPPGTP